MRYLKRPWMASRNERERGGGGGGGRERERERERERGGGRQTDRQTDRQTETVLCPSTAGNIPQTVFHRSLSSSIQLLVAPRFGLLADLRPSVCHSVLLIVHLLYFIRAMCPAHFHLVLVTYWTMSVTLVLCLMVELRILSSSLTSSILLYIARWLLSSFFTNGFVRDHVWHPYVFAGKTHWLKTSLFKVIGRCLSRKISLYFPKTLHPAFILIETSCFVLFPIAIVCPRYLQLVTFTISVPFLWMLSVVSMFVINLVCPLCILRPILKVSSFTEINWCSISLTSSVVRVTSSANPRFDSYSPSIFIRFSSIWAFLNT